MPDADDAVVPVVLAADGAATAYGQLFHGTHSFWRSSNATHFTKTPDGLQAAPRAAVFRAVACGAWHGGNGELGDTERFERLASCRAAGFTENVTAFLDKINRI